MISEMLQSMANTGRDDPRCWYALRRRNEHFRRVLKKDPCAYCGAPQPRKFKDAKKLALQDQATIDHIVPKSTLKHGEGYLNWTASCWNCNHLKKDTKLLFFLLDSNQPKGQICIEPF